MKITGPIIPVMLVSLTSALNAQEAANSDLEATRAAQKAPPATTPFPTEITRDSIKVPEPNVPELSQIDEIFRQTSLGKEADERRLHIEWRELANRVVADPAIVAAKKEAAAARTDLEKRQRLRDYYEIYYARMRSLASSSEMKTALDQLKLAHLSQTSQPRVRSATDNSLPSPSPTPKGKHQKGQRFRKYES